MNVSKIIELNNAIYKSCIVVQTHQSLHEIKNLLEEDIYADNLDGKILLDTLFHDGNTENRFIEFTANKGVLNWDTIKFVGIERRGEIRKQIARFLSETPEILDQSILTRVQKKMISKGIGI